MDPAQSYYKGLSYRSGTDFHNLSRAEDAPVRAPDSPCLDSSQAYFCRDLWIRSARDAMDEVDRANGGGGPPRIINKREANLIDVAARDPLMEEAEEARLKREAAVVVDADANAGSDYDAMSDEEGGEYVPPPEEPGKLSIPNSVFRPARILVNPRCPTTYAGVSHTQLALDLFGDGEDSEEGVAGKYVLEDWEGAPESFVCQEQRSVPTIQNRLALTNVSAGKQVDGRPQKLSVDWGSHCTMSCRDCNNV